MNLKMRVKICGITNAQDALMAVDCGADAVGFVFYPESPRSVSSKEVRDIIRQLPPFVMTVGVFANQEQREIQRVVDECSIDLIQLQGDEPPYLCESFGDRVIKAVRIKDHESLARMDSYAVRAFVLDTYCENQLGGTGKSFDWNIAVEAKKYGRIILAGGLTPQNVTRAIEQVKPSGVDVSSGVEKQIGHKDSDKIRRFIEAAKKSFSQVSR